MRYYECLMYVDQGKSAFENRIFRFQGIFFTNFGFKNGCINIFKDNNEKSAAKNRVPHKTILKLYGHADSVGVKIYNKPAQKY